MNQTSFGVEIAGGRRRFRHNRAPEEEISSFHIALFFVLKDELSFFVSKFIPDGYFNQLYR
jgi:hypothetical protein